MTHDPVSVNQERVSLCHSGTRFCDPERLCMYLWLRNPPLGLRSAFPATQVPVSVIQERVFLIQNPFLCLRSTSL